MLMDRQTTLPSAKTPLDFYIRVLYGKRVGILVDVGEAAGHDCLPMWFLEPNSAEEKIPAKPESRRIKQFAQGEVLEDLEDLVNTQIKPWIEACYNRRRIMRIAAVHYCWGRGNDVAKTTTGNLEDRLRSFDIAYLPKTVQDAIILTRMMNIRYLWVDAICIIQSSENDDYSEFQTEASKMRDYYANAERCIAASVANDAAEGFLRERLLGRYPIQFIFLTYPGTVGPDRQSITLHSKENVATLRNVIDESPLSKRGWCLQELSLPPRVLHWTSNGLYRECQSSYFLEGSSKKWETYDYAATATPRDILAMPDNKLLTHDGWHRLLRLLSEKGLTFSKDRIYAIHGIACLIIERLKVEYFNGVFRPYLAQGLAWNYSPRGPFDALPDVSVEPRDDRFPTWCWASNGPVQFSDIPKGDWHSYIHDVHPHMFPTYPGNTSLTDIIDSKLHIKAPIIHVDLVYELWESFPPSGNVSIDCDDGEPLDHYFWVWLDNQLGSNHSTATNILHNASRDTLLKGVTVQQKNCEGFSVMSANTTASQQNGMEFLKDNNTADKKIQVNMTPPLPVRRNQSITGNTKTHHRFGEFPREIQIKIFKLALPDPRIVYLRLELVASKHEEGTCFHTSVRKTRAPGLLPLLETCTTSNASVYLGDGFTKIKIEPLDGHPHTTNEMSTSTPLIADKMTGLLDDVYSRCPGLKRLSVIGSHDCAREMPSATRLLNTDKNLLKLDLKDKDGRQVPSEEADDRYRVLEKILKARYLFDRHFELYRKEIEEERNYDAIEYWKKVEVVDVLCCWPDESQDESNFYIPEIDSYVRCDDDGFLATLPESTPDKLIKLRDTLKLVELGDEQWLHELHQEIYRLRSKHSHVGL
ncbi:uncharacterized protein EAE98_009865 [Botrytis deweyae]|uniref:Heterokaryon incompatibility domain-containing protein n=1 Tax=Botrytis deweyae TaxID=2478750 RepID=A0ABQ7IB58_9HELO|nr:uncharacterized protein EAE98_009865 [Botrytis deweyae]KAF7918253.1 hypothetical protein EAE98_009865 [Botrytis deweyae]